MTLLKTGLLCLSLSLLAAGTAEANRTARRGKAVRTATTARTTARTTASKSGLRRVSSMKISSSILRAAKQQSSSMTASLKNNATPPMSFFPTSSSVKWTQTRASNYKTGVTPTFSVSNLGKSGKIDMMMLLPTSGHTGQANAAKWAVTSKYNIKITHADGTVQNLGKVQSLAYVTEHGMSINLQKGKTIIQMWADGSAGVGGFRSGREMEVHWNGN